MPSTCGTPTPHVFSCAVLGYRQITIKENEAQVVVQMDERIYFLIDQNMMKTDVFCCVCVPVKHLIDRRLTGLNELRLIQPQLSTSYNRLFCIVVSAACLCTILSAVV